MPAYSGPTDEVKHLADNIEEFKRTFETPSEFISVKENFNHEIAKDEIIGSIEDEIRKECDAIIEMEIMNRRKIYLKGKRDPKVPNRPPKPKPIPEKFGPGEKKLKDRKVPELFETVSIC